MGTQMLYGLQRMASRFARHQQLVIDNDMKNAPTFAGLFVRPWVTAPTKVDKGAFGIDTNGRIATSDGVGFVPAVGLRNFISVSADRVLLSGEAGALISANGNAALVTLPTPQLGLWYEIVLTGSVLSGTLKIITASASQFLLGTFIQSTDGTYVTATHTANGTTHRSWNGNGSTTGGIAGDHITLIARSSTVWQVFGRGSATGAEATPFATS